LILGITQGDASGVGPEIVLKTFRDGQLPPAAVVYGDLAALEHYNRYGVPLRAVRAPSDWSPGALNVIDAAMLSPGGPAVGRVDAACGAAAKAYIASAARAALAGEIGAIVTLPINKEAVQLTTPGFTGHTEYLGELCGVADTTILLASQELIVTHVSTHCSLAEAIARLTPERLRTILGLTMEAVARLKPGGRIAVAGLNPHAGENGLFGREDLDIIRPAVEWAREQGWPVEGPVPPDTVFYLAVRRRLYDVVVCMYHDQGHIPLKLLDFEGGVNITLGLPIVRTSVDHGTAFDIAGRDCASTHSFVQAIDYAVRLAPKT
jgi:4-hydroxythreonine-4-phosphate dehydrogenase